MTYLRRRVIWIYFLSLLTVPALAKDKTPSRSEAAALFQKLDTDHNQQLSASEFIITGGTLTPGALRQRFRVFDEDQNQRLSLAEFLTIPGLFSNDERGHLTDPLKTWSEKQIEAALSELALPVDAQEFEKKWDHQLPRSIPLEAAVWDRNQDGKIDAEEAEIGLRIAYGLLRSDGLPARWSNGFVFNGSYFQHVDRDNNNKISSQEFIKVYFTGPKQARELFQAADQDQNGELSLTEIDAAELFRTDVSTTFLAWDRNQDGYISRKELQLGEDWQQNVASHLFPGFDTNEDGQLSFDEFQLCPLGNPVANWTTLRTDTNFDGYLDLREFRADSKLSGAGLASEFFDRFDLNHDHRLSLNEFRYEYDESKFAPQLLLEFRDQDGDQLFSKLELFTPLGQLPQPDDKDELIALHTETFSSADQNADGLISPDELRDSPTLQNVAKLERKLRRFILLKFNVLDRDQSFSLSMDEWLISCPKQLLTSRRREYVIADFDQNRELSFSEFASMPMVSSVHERPEVVDSILEELKRVSDVIEKQFQKLSSPPGASVLVPMIAEHLSFFSEADLIGWDLNQDGAYQFQEVQHGLQRLFAVKTADGMDLRRPNGQVFNLRSMKYADRDHNLSLSHSEFIMSYWKHGAAAEADFQSADTNHDQILTLSELLHSDLYWIDTQVDFRRFDSNLDGLIDAEELRQQAMPYESRIASAILPGFDENGDQKLSFREFRKTPLANPLHDYNARRWDLDLDGQLSLEEFHQTPDNNRQMLGLTAFFFDRLDRNRDQRISFDELKFTADLKRESADVVFQILDVNSDNRLLLEELMPRQNPRDNSAFAKRRAEQRTMEVEDAFQASDTDGDRGISLAEFEAKEGKIHSVVVGSNPRRTPVRASGESQMSDANSSSGLSWRMIGLITFNLILFLGLGWWRYRS